MILIKTVEERMSVEDECGMKIFADLSFILQTCKTMGYKKLWINKAPDDASEHWKEHRASQGHMFGWPRTKTKGRWPALWYMEELNQFKPMCGNGLTKYDQRQFGGIDHLPSGEYDLRKQVHELVKKIDI